MGARKELSRKKVVVPACQPEFLNLRSPRIDSKGPIPPGCVARAGIFKESMGQGTEEE
jgi:hypothetical protein